MADVKVDRWRSIPYAEPPLGELRFLPPRPRQRWAGVWDSRGQPSTCTQISGAAFGNFSGEQVGTAVRPSIHPFCTADFLVSFPLTQSLFVLFALCFVFESLISVAFIVGAAHSPLLLLEVKPALHTVQ